MRSLFFCALCGFSVSARQAGLGGGLGLLALILAAVILRRHLRDNWSEEKLRAYDDAKAAKLRAKKAKDAQAATEAAAKEAEADRRKQAKQARKYAAQGAGAEGVPNGAAVVPAGANSASPPVPSGGRSSGGGGGSGAEGFVGLSDIELGPPTPRSPASPHQRRDASSPRTKKSSRHDAHSDAHAQPPAARQKGYTDSRKSKKSSKKTKSSSAAAASSSSTGPAPVAMPDELEGVPSVQAASSSSSAQPALCISQPLAPDAWQPTRVAVPDEVV